MAQTARVDWRETGLPRWAKLEGTLVFRVSTIRIGPGGWSVTGSLTNRTGRAVTILPHGHDPEPAGFGILVTRTGSVADLNPSALESWLVAQRYDSRPPKVLDPGRQWRGTFFGPQQISAGHFVHVVFGQLGILRRRAAFITDHAYRVR